jgi:hypothetical protein
MGFLDLLKQAISKSASKSDAPAEASVQPPKPQQKKVSRQVPKKTAKEIATEQNEPYVAIISVELDPENIGAGAFELDWNDRFLAQLVRAGYQYKANEPEHVIVDRWFQDICRNVVLENYEQEQADPEIRKNTRKRLDSGRTEVS